MCGWLAAIAAMPPAALDLGDQLVVDVAGGVPQQVAGRRLDQQRPLPDADARA